jgi:hypothetical protein
LILPLSNLGYRKNSMKVKIAIFDAASVYVRVTFTDTSLAGTYYTNDNQPKRISNAVYKDGYLYFKIPELQLYFEMRRVGDRFDGKMTVYGTSEKRAPEPMRMTKSS